jgi:hypothetical protein
VRAFLVALVWLACCAATSVPSNLHLSLTTRALTFDHDGRIVSTAIVCPGYEFDQFGTTGPRFSPDNHWVLVDVKGPFTPGNVPRTHALVEVTSGRIVLAPNFQTYLGIPPSLEPIAWASGQRATVAYPNGKSAPIHDPPLRALPAERCGAGTPASAGGVATPAPATSATPFPF